MQITAHFAAREFDCHDGTPYPPSWYAERLKPLCDLLEAVREALGAAPVTVISGYRSPAYNGRLVGAAKQSQHMEGRAADISVRGVSPAKVRECVLALDRAGKVPQLGGLGVYPGWVHVDVRPRKPGGAIARWVGEGFGSEPIA